MAVEKRVDPDDGEAYTYEELAAFYKGKFKKTAIDEYWEECKLVKTKKGRRGEEAAPAAKAKAKAKVKAKAKAKAKAAVPRELPEEVKTMIAGIEALLPTFGPGVASVADFDADASGQKCSLGAFKAAFAKVGDGGGVVKVPKGKYLLQGPLLLQSSTVLELDEGAYVVFSNDPAHYMPCVHTWFEASEIMNFSPFVFAKGLHDVGIRGKGTLDAQGLSDCWMKMAHDKADALEMREVNQKKVPVAQRVYGLGRNCRPNFIEFFECQRVLLEGVTILNAVMWSVHLVLCQGVNARNVTVSAHGFNNDGIDPDMSTDVLIKDCHFNCSDDGVAVKAGRDEDGRRIGVKTERIVVLNCIVTPNPEAEKTGEGARNGMAIGSEGSAGVNDVWIIGCKYQGRQRGIYVKSNTDRGGTYERIHIVDCKMKDIKADAVRISMDYSKRVDGDWVPTFKDINFSGLQVEQAGTPFYLSGLERSHLDGVTVKNSVFRRCGGVGHVTLAKTVTLENVSVSSKGYKDPAKNEVPKHRTSSSHGH